MRRKISKKKLGLLTTKNVIKSSLAEDTFKLYQPGSATPSLTGDENSLNSTQELHLLTTVRRKLITGRQKRTRKQKATINESNQIAPNQYQSVITDYTNKRNKGDSGSGHLISEVPKEG